PLPPPTPPLFPYTTLFRSPPPPGRRPAPGGRGLPAVGAPPRIHVSPEGESARRPGSSSTRSSFAPSRSNGDPDSTRGPNATPSRSEEHTSELQSLTNLVCR